MLRSTGLFLAFFSCSALSASAQSPLIQLVPPSGGPGTLGPRTVIAPTIACTDLPTISIPDPPLRVLAPHSADKHLISRAGDIVVLNGGTGRGFAVGQRYYTRRVTLPISREPISAVDRGAIRTSGWLTVVAADDQSTLARIDYACTAIEAGDYLEPYVEPAVPTAVAADGRTDFTNLGRVLSGVDRREQFGAGELVSIDRGAAQGVSLGTRVGFYRDREMGTPLVEIGVGIVIEVVAESAKVVLEWTHQDVRRGDYYGVRGTP
jgi:hypothetical protein